LLAARAASLRDRQASVYQLVLVFTAHQTETRRNMTRTIRYDPKTEARLQGLLDEYSVPNWFDLEGSVLAFCPDSVVQSFIAAKAATMQSGLRVRRMPRRWNWPRQFPSQQIPAVSWSPYHHQLHTDHRLVVVRLCGGGITRVGPSGTAQTEHFPLGTPLKTFMNR
jgi:hypothetical protein